MKDMNWPERVAYLENQLADSDRDNQRLREFIEGLPDGDEIVRLQKLLQKVMARCADLLDEDQFNELDAMTRTTETVNGDSGSAMEGE